MAQEAPASAGQESSGGDKVELTETTLASIVSTHPAYWQTRGKHRDALCLGYPQLERFC